MVAGAIAVRMEDLMDGAALDEAVVSEGVSAQVSAAAMDEGLDGAVRIRIRIPGTNDLPTARHTG